MLKLAKDYPWRMKLFSIIKVTGTEEEECMLIMNNYNYYYVTVVSISRQMEIQLLH
jgi:hypothetical protein